MNKEFNGHKNWNHWNVSLWLTNDETAYRKAKFYLRIYPKNKAAEKLLEWLGGAGATTPDGAPYSVSSIRAAMRDI